MDLLENGYYCRQKKAVLTRLLYTYVQVTQQVINVKYGITHLYVVVFA